MLASRLLSVCLCVMVLCQVLVANPLRANDEGIDAVEEDISALVDDVYRIFRDTQQRDRARTLGLDDNRRGRRYIHFAVGSDHKHNSYRRRPRFNHRARQGGLVIVPT